MLNHIKYQDMKNYDRVRKIFNRQMLTNSNDF